ncbi:ECF-type sigma factor [Aquisphaera insulae]|uniref:ECF-type sigma factor n=1 Tax=Aquisphaera insulae TaxID=2712864 RepID=UPI0013EB489B|nr:ECF-type sigma factor [Aquisphaera insulae]
MDSPTDTASSILSTAAHIATLRGRLGDREGAATAIWARYYERLVERARAAYPSVRRSADPEDLAASTFRSVLGLIESGSTSAPDDGFGLWLLLLKKLHWKSLNHLRKERAQRRGGGVINLSAIGPDEAEAEPAAAGPSPDVAAMLADELDACFEALGDDLLKRVARLRLDGYGVGEIAQVIGMSRATVDRKLRLIRKIWRHEEDDDGVSIRG